MTAGIKVITVFGTRPEAIKMAPVVVELTRNSSVITHRLAVTAQHRELLDSVLDLFNLEPDLDLDIMQRGQSLQHITSATLDGLTTYLEAERPDLVLVHGDTTTTFAASLAAFYLRIPVAHVEAGLRTGNRFVPFPEEMNRRLTDELVTFFLAPTALAKRRLLEREIEEESIFVTGNTVVDALQDIAAREHSFSDKRIASFLESGSSDSFRILFTMHRRESWGVPMRAIFESLASYLEANPGIKVIYPVHPNPVVSEPANKILGGIEAVTLVDALDYLNFVHLMKGCDLIVSDSGGIQEEAPSLGKYTLILREATERPEVVDAGFAELCGNDPARLIPALDRAVSLAGKGEILPANLRNPIGDGQAAKRTVSFLLYKFGLADSTEAEFE